MENEKQIQSKKMTLITKEQTEEIAQSIKNVYGERDINVGVYLTKIKYKNVEDFVMVFQKITELACKNLKPSSCKVLLFFISKCNYSNSVGVDVKTIAEQINVTKSTVMIALKELKDAHIILSTKDCNDSRRNVYYINPLQAWKGTTRERGKFLKKQDKAQMVLFAEQKFENNGQAK